MALFLLFEAASGYGLFERVEADDIGRELPEVQASVLDLAKFSKIMKVKSFIPFKSAAHALENVNDVSEGVLNDYLKNFLEVNLPIKPGKKSKFELGLGEPKLGGAIADALSIKVTVHDPMIQELLRGIRFHIGKMIKVFKDGDIEKAQLGLGHSYSRARVKFNVNRQDNMIIQAICLLDQLDKDLNLFSMRIREWYSWHFPELVKIVNDNYMYARCAKLIKNKSRLTDADIPALEEIVLDEVKAKQIVDAAKSSMGTDTSEIDMSNIEIFATKVISLCDYRKYLHSYLQDKMHVVAPNLSALIGEAVGARLISHAGSLTSLSKLPASTVQILGAEKALFRALKTKGNTPKYGLIYHSTFIGKAGAKNKGRISRYLANKCSLASRIDCFSDLQTDKFGEALREQVDDRLSFYETGSAPTKNVDVMRKVIESLGEVDEMQTEKTPKSAKKKKRKAEEAATEENAEMMEGIEMETETPKKKKKKDAETPKTPSSDKKKKKKKKNDSD